MLKVVSLLENWALLTLETKVSSLPYGQQRRLEIARALAPTRRYCIGRTRCRNEPKETEDLTEFIRQLREDFDLSIFMIEHHMDVVMGISERIYVLDYGITIAQGSPYDIQNNQRVIEAYLGVNGDA